MNAKNQALQNVQKIQRLEKELVKETAKVAASNWQHGRGEGSAERTVTIVSIIVIVLIVVWRVAVLFGG